ncbi:MAG TPA: FAD-dependent oxidoreductase [Longimicrobium sp.]|nr:FAD-dependent oxidoreductase [Longimicrobium sp.]
MTDTHPPTQPPERRREQAVRVIADRWSAAAHEVKDFLTRRRVRYHAYDPQSSDEARRLLETVPEGERAKLPLVLFPDGSWLAAPSLAELAEKLGHATEAAAPFYDLLVVGGGPAGLAAAVYGASEGLRVLVLDREAPGGQAAQSARIENYLGFPDGLTGAEFAERALRQAHKFGVEVVVARAAEGFTADGDYRGVRLDDGSELGGHVVLVSTGVSWTTLDAPGCPGLVGSGVYYGAAAAEAPTVRDKDVYLLGAGNSSAQAALLLARHARTVHVLAQEADFSERMSQYLYDRLRETPNVNMRPLSTVARASGDGRLREIIVRNVESGEEAAEACEALFVFIGAAPQTEWLGDAVLRDERGYLLTGPAAKRAWRLERDPHPRETSCPGVFAAGDVRAGAVKRVGSAVGDGSVAIQFIHEYLAER